MRPKKITFGIGAMWVLSFFNVGSVALLWTKPSQRFTLFRSLGKVSLSILAKTKRCRTERQRWGFCRNLKTTSSERYIIHPQTGWKITIFNRRNIFLEVKYTLEVYRGEQTFMENPISSEGFHISQVVLAVVLFSIVSFFVSPWWFLDLEVSFLHCQRMDLKTWFLNPPSRKPTWLAGKSLCLIGDTVTSSFMVVFRVSCWNTPRKFNNKFSPEKNPGPQKGSRIGFQHLAFPMRGFMGRTVYLPTNWSHQNQRNSCCLVVSTHLKNMHVKLDHFPRDRGEKKI